jgi:hypothetical protein
MMTIDSIDKFKNQMVSFFDPTGKFNFRYSVHRDLPYLQLLH